MDGHKKESNRNQPRRQKPDDLDLYSISPKIAEAIILAAERAGSDGNGTDGLLGYMVTLARHNKKTFFGLLLRLVVPENAAETASDRDPAQKIQYDPVKFWALSEEERGDTDKLRSCLMDAESPDAQSG